MLSGEPSHDGRFASLGLQTCLHELAVLFPDPVSEPGLRGKPGGRKDGVLIAGESVTASYLLPAAYCRKKGRY